MSERPVFSLRHSADDLHRTDRLLDGLNVHLITRDEYAKGNAVTNAVDVALEASADGHWVRLHTFEHNGAGELRVDVFDVPPR